MVVVAVQMGQIGQISLVEGRRAANWLGQE